MSMVEPGSDISSGSIDSGSSGPPPMDPKRKKQRTYVLIGGGVVVALVVYIYAKRKSASTTAAASTTASGSGTNSTTPTLVLPSSNQDATLGSDFASLSAQLAALQAAQQGASQPGSGTGSGSGSGTGTTTTPTPTSNSPGYNYVAVTNPSAIAADIASGQTLYQSSAEANAWDLANGTPAGQTLAAPGQYFGLSGPAATNLGASGQPVYVRQPTQ